MDGESWFKIQREHGELKDTTVRAFEGCAFVKYLYDGFYDTGYAIMSENNFLLIPSLRGKINGRL
jgi:hypothetical protein